MGVIKDISALQPTVAAAAERALRQLEDRSYMVTETVREKVTQVIYYCNGRAPVELCDELYAKFGIPRSPKDQKVTWTLDSRHFDGKAIDVYPMKDGKVLWNYSDDPAAWDKIISVFKAEGFSAGADWAQKDYPHFEIS